MKLHNYGFNEALCGFYINEPQTGSLKVFSLTGFGLVRFTVFIVIFLPHSGGGSKGHYCHGQEEADSSQAS